MKSIAINTLFLCTYMICNNQLQAMDSKATQEPAEFINLLRQASCPLDKNFLLEQAIRAAITLKNTPHFQETMNRALVTALDNESVHSRERFEIFKRYGISFNIVLDDGKTLLHRYAIIPQTVIWLLHNTDIDGNKQDNKGNTLAHYFAESGISNRPLLVKLFNTYITKNINPLIKNNEGKTAKDIALEQYYQYQDFGHTHHANTHASCANLLSKLEAEFDRTKRCFFAGGKFVLLDDGDTIEFSNK